MIKIALLMTGEEILAGDTLDTNSHFLSAQLKMLGWDLRKICTVGDDPQAIYAEILALTQDCDLLIVNGGLGPTTDDYTNEVLAKILQVPLVEHPQELAKLLKKLHANNRPVSAANRKQVTVPEGAKVYANPAGAACGVEVWWQNCRIIATPGVPRELYAMWEQEILPALVKLYPQQQKRILGLRTFGVGESILSTWNAQLGLQSLAGLSIGYRVFLPYVDMKVTAAGTEFWEQQQKILSLWERGLGTFVLGRLDAEQKTLTLAAQVLKIAIAKKVTLALAESISGGGIAHLITALSGASKVLHSAVVSYQSVAKKLWLHVEPALTEPDRVVSYQTAVAMAQAVQQKTGASWALGITGFAEKSEHCGVDDVGLVHFVWINQAQQIFHRSLKLSGTRVEIQNLAAAAALDALRRLLLDAGEGCVYNPAYSFDRNNTLTGLSIDFVQKNAMNHL